MHSFLLMRHDTLIAEGYYAPYQKDTLHRMFSISKSFTSIAIGLLEAEGKQSCGRIRSWEETSLIPRMHLLEPMTLWIKKRTKSTGLVYYDPRKQ